MTSRRTAKAAEAIRETVSTTILFGLKDPRIQGVTVLSVEVTGDLRHAKVYVSVMGTEKQQAKTMHGLRAARGYLQSKLAERLQTRNTPVIEFVLDQGVKRSLEASRLLRESGTDFSVPPDDPAGLSAEDADRAEEETEEGEEGIDGAAADHDAAADDSGKAETHPPDEALTTRRRGEEPQSEP